MSRVTRATDAACCANRTLAPEKVGACCRRLAIQRRELYLLRKRVGDRTVAIVLDENPADNEHGIAWRKDLRHVIRNTSFPVRSTENVVAGRRSPSSACLRR